MYKPIVLAALAVGLSSQAPAQGLTQEQAVRQALTTHPRALAARSAMSAAGFAASSAKPLRNPVIVLNPAITPEGTDNEFVASLMFEVNGTKRARSAAAGARLSASRFALATELRDLASDTIIAHTAVARLQECLNTERELLSIAEDLERMTRRQVEVGTRPGLDLVNLEVETLRQRRAVRVAEAELRASRATLAALVGGDAEALVVASLPERSMAFRIDAHDALTERTEVGEQEALADATVGDRREAEAEGRPDLGVQAVSGSFTREPKSGGVGLLLTLPIFDFGSRRGRITELRRLEEAQRYRAEAVRREVLADVSSSREKLGAAEANLSVYRDRLLDQAKRLLEASRVGFQAGQTTIVQLLEAQRTYRTVQTEYVQAKADYTLAVADAQRAAGTLATDLIKEVAR